MPKKFEYTTLALRYTARFPRLTYVGTQINFWIIANILLVAIMHQQSRIISHTYKIPVETKFGPMVVIAVILGLLYGIILGVTGYYIERNIFRSKPLGKVIVLKTVISWAVLVLILSLLRYVLFDKWISPALPEPGTTLNDDAWRSLFFLLVIYYFVMTLVISFINQVNKKYGPGILVPLLLGRYRKPKEAERIFMFMDLKSSTTTAEALGHLKYSAFIRDCFADINEVLYPFRAQVYQYVGDEIVLTWPEREGLRNHCCIAFFFACQRQFSIRSEYYTTHYNILPSFKAGIHTGPVTIVEIGDIKRDIAYHGDTLNTAARLQSVCNEFGKSFIASKILIDKAGPCRNMETEDLGMIMLKGKVNPVGLVSVTWID